VSAAEALDGLPLVDHHCHGVVLDDVDNGAFLDMLTEGADSLVRGLGVFDSQVGVAVRRWCSPVLGLPAHAPAEAYLARRQALGGTEVSGRLLRACGVGDVLVDTGLSSPGLCSPDRLATAAGARAHSVLRLETVAEDVAAAGVSADDYADAVTAAVTERGKEAVALKTIAAYRTGLELPGRPPTATEVRIAAHRWLRRCEEDGGYRLDDPVLVAHGVWCGAGEGLPLQIHVGFGDPDLTLHRCDPLLLTDFVRATSSMGVPVVLLHCYPYHRQAAYLANVYAHVAVDVGLALGHVGLRSTTVLAEVLELAPFGSLLYSSDGAGLAELHHLGAVLFRHALGTLLDGWVVEDAVGAPDAERYARMIGADNARRIYGPALSRS
jgi:predicted TIM-barrel fold metal-dependent hydrolase